MMIECKINGKTDSVDIYNPENITKIPATNAEEGFTCEITYVYRLGSGQPMLRGNLTYEYVPEATEKPGGCGAGAYMIYALLPLGLLPIFKKRK